MLLRINQNEEIMKLYKIHNKVIVQKIKYLFLLFIFVCVISSLGINNSYGEILSSDRKIDWSPGMPGGIPNYPIGINVKDSPYNAEGDGISDDTAAIQAAIDACPSGHAVYLPAGTYRTTSQLSIFCKSIVLRGAGSDSTFIKNDATSGNVIKIYSYSGSSTANVTGGYTKGSTTITVDNPSALSAEHYVTIDQDNDPAVTENIPSYCTRAIAQIVKMTNISGNDITINRPLYYTYNPSMNIKATALYGGSAGKVSDAGIEDLYIERTSASDTDTINFTFAVNCWIKNIESYNAGRWHVRLRQSYACEVRDSYFHHAFTYGGDHGYGVGLFQKSTDNLIVNNIFYHLRHSMLIEYGGCGNVFAYNYSKDPVNENGESTDWLMADFAVHGGHPYMNLFEGNIGAHMNPDNALGSNRHNTFFRNQAIRESIPSVIYHLYAIDIHQYGLYENFVGNILGLPGATGNAWRLGCNSDGKCSSPDPRVESTLLNHGNYDYVTDSTQWDESIDDHTLPNSYYLSSKPSFFGSYSWPSIGPDLNPKVGTLPAKKRFDDMQSGTTNAIPSAPINLKIR